MNSIFEAGMTLNNIIDASCVKYKDNSAIGMAMDTPLSYGDFYEKIVALAARFQREGVEKGDRIAILSENSHKWGMAYLATVRVGAVAVPILPDLPEGDVHHILNAMQVKALFISQKQVEKIYELRNAFKAPVITLDDYLPEISVVDILPFTSYLEEAVAALKENGEPEFPVVEEDDIASILYTSGTSGYSKAVMLSHKNLASNAVAASSLMDIPPKAVWLSILPMSHTYEFTCGFILPLLAGGRIAYAGKTPTPAILQKLCKFEKPLLIFAVPLVLEKIYKKRVLPQIENSALLQKICKFEAGRKFIYRKIGKKLRSFFGGNLQLMGVGGAALNPDVEKFLYEAKFPYLVGYGMTESAPLIAGGPLNDPTISIGSTGKPIPGVEVDIEGADPETGIGEILARGPNVMLGYYNDAEETAAAISEDGWLSTGDLGKMDEQGNLHVCGRSKNVIIMSNGENVYPEAIEHKINSFHWVVESLVVEKDGLIEAWIYPDYEFIDEQTAGYTSNVRHNYIDTLLDELREELNTQLPKAARLTKAFERREPFIKTATHKIKRYLYNGHALMG